LRLSASDTPNPNPGQAPGYGRLQRVRPRKYIPVRELALCIEESLVPGTKWAVFEPNHEPLCDDMAKPPQTAWSSG